MRIRLLAARPPGDDREPHDGVPVAADPRRGLPFRADSVEDLVCPPSARPLAPGALRALLGELGRVARDGARIEVVFPWYASWQGLAPEGPRGASEGWVREVLEPGPLEPASLDACLTPLAPLLDERLGVSPDLARRLFLGVGDRLTARLVCRKPGGASP